MPPCDGAPGGATSHIKKGIAALLSICLVKGGQLRDTAVINISKPFFFSLPHLGQYRLTLYHLALTAGWAERAQKEGEGKNSICSAALN